MQITQKSEEFLVDPELIEKLAVENGEKLENSPRARISQQQRLVNAYQARGGRISHQKRDVSNVFCPCCKASGDFL